MKQDLGISEKHLDSITKVLSITLADEMLLYVKTRKFHWNVSGESFMELHKLFESQYKALEELIDSVAERIGKLGGKTIGTLNEFASLTRLEESPDKYPSQKDMLKELLSDHETIIRQMRNDIDDCAGKYKDAVTADFLTGAMAAHETTAWILRRFLK